MKKKKPYYPILESEISKNGIQKKDIARKLGIADKTMSKKLNGKLDFWLHEALIIHEIFSNIPCEKLFSQEIV